MNKREKILMLLMLFILVVFFIFNNSYATSIPGLGNLSEYNAKGVSPSPNFNTKVNNVINVIRVVGSLVSVIVLVVLGIKYMFGSVEERAEYKETMKPYLIGAILVFGITNVTGILYNLAKNMI